jgi:hypothetical protein
VLDADDQDLPLVQAVLARSQELRIEYDDSLAEAIGAQTASKLLPPLTRHLSRLVNALARAMSH